MSDLHDLIRACKAEPEDDAPRLVLADWLDDHGEADRAAFIRRQVAAPEEKAWGKDVTAEWAGAWRRWADNWQRENEGWVYPLHWERGFLRVGDYYRELYDGLAAILNPPFGWTWVEDIRFGSWHEGDWSPLIESPLFLELNRASFDSDHYAPVLVEPLSKSPNVSHLKYLGLFMVNVLDEGVAKLSQATHLARLRSLEISFGGIGERGSRAFARSEVWDLLESCHLRCNPLGDAGVAELARGRQRRFLRHLDIAHSDVTDNGLTELSKSDRFPGLQSLEVGCGYSVRSPNAGPAFGPEGIVALLTTEQWALKRLHVSVVSDTALAGGFEELRSRFADRLIIQQIGTDPHR